MLTSIDAGEGFDEGLAVPGGAAATIETGMSAGFGRRMPASE
ncbi:hypothetical protein [Methylibium sp.]